MTSILFDHLIHPPSLTIGTLEFVNSRICTRVYSWSYGPFFRREEAMAIESSRNPGAFRVSVQTERHSVTLKYRSRSGEDWSDVAQRIPIVWTPCRFGSERPWLVCAVASNGVYCGRRVIKMYVAGRMFACRRCYGLVYASQQETVSQRGRRKAQKIRMRLGGSPSMMDDFPHRPRGMHEQTFERWRRIHDAAEERSTNGLIRFVELLGRRISRRAS